MGRCGVPSGCGGVGGGLVAAVGDRCIRNVNAMRGPRPTQLAHHVLSPHQLTHPLWIKIRNQPSCWPSPPAPRRLHHAQHVCRRLLQDGQKLSGAQLNFQGQTGALGWRLQDPRPVASGPDPHAWVVGYAHTRRKGVAAAGCCCRHWMLMLPASCRRACNHASYPHSIVPAAPYLPASCSCTTGPPTPTSWPPAFTTSLLARLFASHPTAPWPSVSAAVQRFHQPLLPGRPPHLRPVLGRHALLHPALPGRRRHCGAQTVNYRQLQLGAGCGSSGSSGRNVVCTAAAAPAPAAAANAVVLAASPARDMLVYSAAPLTLT